MKNQYLFLKKFCLSDFFFSFSLFVWERDRWEWRANAWKGEDVMALAAVQLGISVLRKGKYGRIDGTYLRFLFLRRDSLDGDLYLPPIAFSGQFIIFFLQLILILIADEFSAISYSFEEILQSWSGKDFYLLIKTYWSGNLLRSIILQFDY